MLIIFCASIGRFQRQEHLREDGLVEAHAYSLLHAVDVEAKLAKLVPQGWEFVLFAYVVGLYNMGYYGNKQYYYFRLLWLDSPVHYQTCHSSILDTIMFRKLIARDVPIDTKSNSYQLMIN